MKVLSGPALAECIAKVCRGPGPHQLAVAFWGPLIPFTLFPGGFNGVEVILDIAMGGTSKDALVALGVPANPSVFVQDGLHAKLYIGALGAVITSANASTNALGADLRGGRLEELGVWLDAHEDRAAYEEARAEFSRLKRSSEVAAQADIDRAPIRASLRTSIWKPPTADGTSLLSIVAENPERFSDTLFIFADMDLSEDDQLKVEEAREREGYEDVSSLADIMMLKPDEQSRIEAREPHSFIVMFFWHGRARMPELYAYHSINPAQPDADGNVCYFGREDWAYFCKKHEMKGALLDKSSVRIADVETAKRLRGIAGKGARWEELNAADITKSLAG